MQYIYFNFGHSKYNDIDMFYVENAMHVSFRQNISQSVYSWVTYEAFWRINTFPFQTKSNQQICGTTYI